jgi:hypothetical protein
MPSRLRLPVFEINRNRSFQLKERVGSAVKAAGPTRPLFLELCYALFIRRVTAQSRRSCSLRNTRAKGKRLGRPPKDLDARRVATLRAQGVGWWAIAKQLGIGVGTLYRSAAGRSKIQENVFGTRQSGL